MLSDLEGENYSCQAIMVPACSKNAPHRRDRIWVIAHTEISRNCRMPNKIRATTGETSNGREGGFPDESFNSIEDVADTISTNGGGGSTPGQIDNEGRGASKIRGAGIQPGDRETRSNNSQQICEDVSNSKCKRGCGGATGIKYASHARKSSRCKEPGNWDIEPELGRVANGIPNRVDRLKQLGNAVVPQIVEEIGRAIMAAEHHEI